MKLFESAIATGDLTRLLPVFVRSPLWLCLCSLTLTGTMLLAAAPAKAQSFYRPLTFEQNRGQAPKEVKWMGESSSYRALFVGNGATFLHRDEYDTRAMVERQPVPVGNLPGPSSQVRGTSRDQQATPNSRRPRRKLPLLEGTTPAGRSLSSGPKTSSVGAIPSAAQITTN